MNLELAGWVTGGVCSLTVAIIGALRIGRTASTVTENDPGATAWRTLASMDDRLTAAEAEVKALRADLGHERTHSRGQDDAIHQLEQQMARAVKHIRDFWHWIDGGAHPPPPTRPEWLTGLPGWTADNDDDRHP